jgi:hypothetical protein
LPEVGVLRNDRKSPALAYSHTVLSSADPSPTSRTCSEPGNISASRATSLGTSFWSSSSFKPPGWTTVAARGQRRTQDRRECHRK